MNDNFTLVMLWLSNWRNVYLFTIPLRFVFALSNSYIHPDEHFQSVEVLTSKILGYETHIPWEFETFHAARSFGPLYVLYGPLLYLVKYLGLELTPIQIWYLLRLQMCILSWLVTDLCLYWMLPSKQERIKAIFFTSTSFVTLVFQNHLFSNSVETLVVLVAIYIIDDLRFIQESKSLLHVDKSKSIFLLGAVLSFGVFTRVTFPAFLLFPSWYLITYLASHRLSLAYLTLGFVLPTLAFISLDTYLFESDVYIVAPINNLLYNSRVENLSKHGIHPFYTHVLVNLPQLLGPGILFIMSKTYMRTTQFLSVASGSTSVETVSISQSLDNITNYNKNYTIIDAMGTDLQMVTNLLENVGKPVYLITPLASFRSFNASAFKPIWNYTYHIDLDHIEWPNLQSGLGVYELL
ncbi:SMP3 [Candida oxycetoniae]|uniref:Mannosyltransferase n=1 Tax=Candida oxycetoniae TaxID=497107 RepID=A0AAI9SX51_9ASCO|nr:SMP3 [Candida oxycetoniae]KAI3404729.2 SMP3 [Candida oxycetoniae]